MAKAVMAAKEEVVDATFISPTISLHPFRYSLHAGSGKAMQ